MFDCTDQYRFPVDDSQRKAWIDALNISSTNGHGCFGFVCSQHFCSTDIENTKRRIILKKGSIPIRIVQQDNRQESSVNVADNTNKEVSSESNHCERCEVLVSEHEELKKAFIKQRLHYDLEIAKKKTKLQKYHKNAKSNPTQL